ncbi:MAG: hypothetical protein ACWA40_05495 [Planktomarina sp.]
MKTMQIKHLMNIKDLYVLLFTVFLVAPTHLQAAVCKYSEDPKYQRLEELMLAGDYRGMKGLLEDSSDPGAFDFLPMLGEPFPNGFDSCAVLYKNSLPPALEYRLVEFQSEARGSIYLSIYARSDAKELLLHQFFVGLGFNDIIARMP